MGYRMPIPLITEQETRFSGLKFYYSNSCMCSVFRLNVILLHYIYTHIYVYIHAYTTAHIRFQDSVTSMRVSQRLRATEQPTRSFKKTANVFGSIVAVILTLIVVDCVWNVMAHAQKPDFVFRWNRRVHLNRQGHQFSRLRSAEMCASAVVMLNTPTSEVVQRVVATRSIR